MVDSDNSTRFPGWYADPQTSDMERFWDGRQWTGSTRDTQTASAARADVVVDLTSVPGMVPAAEPVPIADPQPSVEPVTSSAEPQSSVTSSPTSATPSVAASAGAEPASAVPAPATSTEVKTSTFEADNGADGLFSQPRDTASIAGAAATPRATSDGPAATTKATDVKPSPTPSALTGLFGKPDPAHPSGTPSIPAVVSSAPEAAKPATATTSNASSTAAPETKSQPVAKQREVVKNPTDTLSARDEVTRDRLESAKARLESETPKAASGASPSMVDLLKPKDDGATSSSKPAATSPRKPVGAKPKVTKAQASQSSTSFPRAIKQPQQTGVPRPNTAAAKPADAKPTTVESRKPKAAQKAAAATPPSTAAIRELEGDAAKKPWGALALIAGLCLAGGGFLLGFLAGGSGTESSPDEVAATTEAPATTVAEAEPVETTVDAALEEAMVAAETRVEELEAESATSAQQISSLEAEVDTLAAERDNEAAHNELLQSWFTADVLSRSQGSWDFEVGRACALEAEPTIDDLNYNRRLEVIGTPADLLVAVQECRG